MTLKNSESLTKQDRAILQSYGMEAEKLTNCAARTYGFGERIVSEGLPNEFLFLVTGGRAKVGVSARNGKNIILCFYISAGLMGEAEYFSGSEVGCTTVTALENLRRILIPIRDNKAYLDSSLAFTRIAAAALADKLLQWANNVIESTLYTAEMRLCRYILDASDGDRFRNVMMDVAYLIGVSYRHLYRMMGVLCRDGILQKNQTGYRICDRARLQERGRPR